MNEKPCILIPIPLKFVAKGLIDTMSVFVQMVPNKQEAIIWINDGLFYWHVYVTEPYWLVAEQGHPVLQLLHR